MGEGCKVDTVSQRRVTVTAFTSLDWGFQGQARESHLKSPLLEKLKKEKEKKKKHALFLALPCPQCALPHFSAKPIPLQLWKIQPLDCTGRRGSRTPRAGAFAVACLAEIGVTDEGWGGWSWFWVQISAQPTQGWLGW